MGESNRDMVNNNYT